MRTYDQANYTLNRKPENRCIYAEQQVAWFYFDLLKAQHAHATARSMSHRLHATDRISKAARDLADAHASLDASHLGMRSVDVCLSVRSVPLVRRPGCSSL